VKLSTKWLASNNAGTQRDGLPTRVNSTRALNTSYIRHAEIQQYLHGKLIYML